MASNDQSEKIIIYHGKELKNNLQNNKNTKISNLIRTSKNLSSKPPFLPESLPYQNKKQIIVYYILNEKIVGYIDSDIDFETKNIYINFIQTNSNYAGKKICQKMLNNLIQDIEQKYGLDIKFSLSNIGGLPGCLCYTKTFADRGYDYHQEVPSKKNNKLNYTSNELLDYCGDESQGKKIFIEGYFYKKKVGGSHKKTKKSKMKIVK